VALKFQGIFDLQKFQQEHYLELPKKAHPASVEKGSENDLCRIGAVGMYPPNLCRGKEHVLRHFLDE
jgi:hypothetical protein